VKVREFANMFPDATPQETAYAEYLERCGLRFLIEFGFDNAEAIAWDRLECGECLLGHA
jgi:hypothetical protein